MTIIKAEKLIIFIFFGKVNNNKENTISFNISYEEYKNNPNNN